MKKARMAGTRKMQEEVPHVHINVLMLGNLGTLLCAVPVVAVAVAVVADVQQFGQFDQSGVYCHTSG